MQPAISYGLSLLVTSILNGSVPIKERIQKVEKVKTELVEGDRVQIKHRYRTCKSHPLWDKDTTILYRIEDNGRIYLVIGTDPKENCTKFNMDMVDGLEIKRADGSNEEVNW